MGTLLLVVRAARDDTRHDLERQAETVAQGTAEVRRQQTVSVLRRVLKLNGASIVSVGPAGTVLGELPRSEGRADVRPG